MAPLTVVGPTLNEKDERFQPRNQDKDAERDVGFMVKADTSSSDRPSITSAGLPIVETNYPFFHLDLDDAVRSAAMEAIE
jgi:hypothetical protein